MHDYKCSRAYKAGVRDSTMTVTPVCPYDSLYDSYFYQLWYQGLYDGRKGIT